MVEKDKSAREDDMHATGSQPPKGGNQAEDAGDLRGAFEHLDDTDPLILYDGFILLDSGHMIVSQYVDIGLDKLRCRPTILVKAIEARYGLEYAANIQLSSPHRFRHYGETLIQDDQEGRARREDRTEKATLSGEEAAREQEAALHLLGEENVTISTTRESSFDATTETLTFGRSSWIYCTSILPPPDERSLWREALPLKYDHESVIRQPRNFALALASMFADQIGAQGQRGHFMHAGGVKSFHSSQNVFHGPVWYTDDVLEFLRSHPPGSLNTMYPLFVKHTRYQGQREYRFVLHCENPVESETLHLQIGGTMRDSLAPPRTFSPVIIQPRDISDTNSSSQTVTKVAPRNKTTTRTRQKSENQRRTLSANDKIVQEEVISREQLIVLTTETPADSLPNLADDPESAVPGVMEIAETENRERWIDGECVDSMAISRTRVYSIADTSGADEHLWLEERGRAAELLEAVGRPFVGFSKFPPALATALQALARRSIDTEVQAMSACWNAIWAICNLYECFGDVVGSIDIEQNRFVAIVLKQSADSHSGGKILVGPRGTFAYVLTRGDERHPGYGGEETRLVFFPDDLTIAAFEEFGWAPIEDAQPSDEGPAP